MLSEVAQESQIAGSLRSLPLVPQGECRAPSRHRQGCEEKVSSIQCLFTGSQLKQIDDPKKRWTLIGKIWAEALLFAASRCGGYQHARRLGAGGELLSHVWLLMAHFGISEQVQTLRAHVPSRSSARSNAVCPWKNNKFSREPSVIE